MNCNSLMKYPALTLWLLAFSFHPALWAGTAVIFNVKDYGATGQRTDDARPAIQRAIDACAAAGGGIVYVPPGEYTAGALHLRSNLRIELEAGATLFASRELSAYDTGPDVSKAALFFGEGIENVTLTGRGTVDGQAQYQWQEDDFERGFKHKTLMQSLGKSLLRSVPRGFPTRPTIPHLVWLGGSKDIQITGLKFLHSPGWTIALYACERVVFERLYIYTSLKEGVWADGIDLDGCRDVAVSNCTIETGDDCLALSSNDVWGPARECANITVSNCRFSSASAGVKFAEGNQVGIRRVLVSNTVLTNVNRGFTFLTGMGGSISEVVLANLTIDCNRFDWFWAGDGQPFFFRVARWNEMSGEPPKPDEAPPGIIRNIQIHDVIAHAKGSSLIHGHPESWLDGVRLEHIRLFVATDPSAPYDQAEDALHFKYAKNLRVSDVTVSWEKPSLPAWQSALAFENVADLEVDSFAGWAAWPEKNAPAILLDQVTRAVIRNSRAVEGTGLFLKVTGPDSRNIWFHGNDLRQANKGCQLDKTVKARAVRTQNNLGPEK